jgi:hypothetical protein
MHKKGRVLNVEMGAQLSSLIELVRIAQRIRRYAQVFSQGEIRLSMSHSYIVITASITTSATVWTPLMRG